MALPENLTAGKTSVTLEIPLAAIAVQAPPPELVSQINCEGAIGVPARTFLELIRAPGFTLPVIKIGRLRLVERAPFIAWLRSRGSAPEESADGAAALLEDLGLEKRGRR